MAEAISRFPNDGQAECMEMDGGRGAGMAWIGQSLKRVEDLPLITGRGQYVSDLEAPGMVHMAVVRSPHAHARVIAIDTARAAGMPGVVGVFTAAELGPIMKPMPGAVRNAPDGRVASPTPLASDRVRFVGEPVAVVLAEDRYLAEDAAAAVAVTYDPLPAVTALEQDAHTPILHDGWPSNVAEHFAVRVGAGAAALAEADVVVEATLRMGRVSGQPMEPRGVLAVWDSVGGRLTVHHATQGPHSARSGLAEMLGLPETAVRVVVPDVGGGFGVKNQVYPEEVLASYLARQLGRPVKWTGDRREEFVSTNQERDQIHHVRLGVKRDGTIVALVDHFLQDAGAYNLKAAIPTLTTAICLPGAYRIPHLEISYDLVLTNKVPVGPYRGAGRPQATYVMERILDRAARALNMDRAAIRLKNLLKPEELPHATGLGTQRGPMRPDSGDFPAGLQAVLEAVDYAGFPARQAEARSQGRYLGLGIATYLESAGSGGEGARMRLYADGTVTVATGASSQGQGHRTALAQVVADRLGVPLEAVRIVEGDTDAIDRGIGTFGSRSLTLVGNAIATASHTLRQRVLDAAAQLMEASPADLEWTADGKIQVRGVPATARSLGEVVAHALRQHPELPGYLEAESYYEGALTFGFGAHAAVVEVDPATCAVHILDYVMAHDSGVVVNPLLADGQAIGAAVQGLGTTLWEELRLDPDTGQPLNTSYLDYLLPASGETPDFRLIHQVFPAPTNPEGFKGVGESGIMATMAVIPQAIENALEPFAVELDAVPVTPDRLFAALGGALDRHPGRER
jgi:carbon-monoxide dehydrogenase large subunit